MPQILMEMERDMITKALRMIFVLLDWVVYRLIGFLTQLIFDIADFHSEIFGDITGRVYLILSIYMLFKITISLISYIIDPDKISDKERGASKLITRIILSLSMLIILNPAFDFLYRAQAAVLETLPRLILGVSMGSTEDGNYQTAQNGGMGETIAKSVFSAFYRENPQCYEDVERNYNPAKGYTVEFALTTVNNDCDGSILFGGDTYAYDYTPILSTLCGVFMVYVLIGIAVTVSVRLFKMILLKAVAPIPIISYIDPKSSKGGAFDKWVKMLLKTWAELFINLSIVYFVIEVIDEAVLHGTGVVWQYIYNLGFWRGVMFTIFFIIGLLLFARQAPKFICDTLGIKSEGTSAFGQIMSPAVGAIGAVAAGGGLAGLASGALSGAQAGFSGAKIADTWNKGRDLGTKLRTGGEDSKYKGWMQRRQENIMQNSAARQLGFRNARDINGYDDIDENGNVTHVKGAYDQYKDQRDITAANLAAATSALENGQSFRYGGQEYSGDALSSLIHSKEIVDKNGNKITGLRIQAAKAESKFNDFSSYVGRFGMGGKRQSDLEKARDARNNYLSGLHETEGQAFTQTNSVNNNQEDVDPMDLMSEAQANARMDSQQVSYTEQFRDPSGTSASSQPAAHDRDHDEFDQYY